LLVVGDLIGSGVNHRLTTLPWRGGPRVLPSGSGADS
jgi:hypothetical protein